MARGLAAWFDSGFARTKAHAPAADVRLGVGAVSVRVEDERAATIALSDTASPQGAGVALPEASAPSPPLETRGGALLASPALAIPAPPRPRVSRGGDGAEASGR
ncbi:MAG TPA: hypothetical protein VM889_10805, partial [Candidatus Thermoplasmatota archaeon]|nr:hypothetical protein [Candidatus Thermoplasmatota archaeon]